MSGEFVIRNGPELFNRPVYGPNNGFRVDAGDKPEFSLYLPGHGGNLKLGFVDTARSTSKWAADADEVIARYRPGRMIYEIRDALLGSGTFHAELLTTGAGSGLLVKAEGHGVPAGARLAWSFAGVSGRKGRRNGDIGCEVEPVSRFFQVRPEECGGNTYELKPASGARATARATGKATEIVLTFPANCVLHIADFQQWHDAFRGKGHTTPGGSATHLPPDTTREVRSLDVEVELYGIVMALLAATLVRA